MIHRKEVTLGARALSIETGALAKQADGSAVVRYGDTVVLVTACAQREPKAVDFTPLTVDYREYTYAAGRIPGGFFKREGRPTEKEILTARQIDRPLRPLFPEGYNFETQVIGFVLSFDPEIDPDVLAVNGAAAALYLSEIPFNTPLGAVRVGRVDGQFIINPTNSELDKSELSVVVVGSEEGITMVEAGANEVTEAVMLEALQRGHQAVRPICRALRELSAEMGIVKRSSAAAELDPAIMEQARAKVGDQLHAVLTTVLVKRGRTLAVKEVQEALLEGVPAEELERRASLKKAFSKLKEEILYREVLQHGKRLDDRAFDQIRSISCQVGVLPRTHGSAIFTRGETQALCTVTLGTPSDVQRVDDLEGESSKRFMLHYNFPPFSVGEVKFMRGPGRREIGHGALAERALRAVLPDIEKFPYTVRVVSDILESNGSSSMATVCAGALALMDAGVPLTRPVSGVAMGLIKQGDKWAVLSDIAGEEDHYGDMDFKVAGTDRGITALQMDIKISGVTHQILEHALEQARRGRLSILDLMRHAIEAPRGAVSQFAPRLIFLKISQDKIRDVIGPGGKTIRSIIERTGVKIDVDDDGKVCIASSDEASGRQAEQIILDLVSEAEVGKVYLGKVERVVDFGAFVQILPGTDGLLHISEIANYRVKNVRDELKEGDKILVKVINIDDQGRVRLSRKAVLQEKLAEQGADQSSEPS
jgi:polyribonucleotide nucleotidyltransferase